MLPDFATPYFADFRNTSRWYLKKTARLIFTNLAPIYAFIARSEPPSVCVRVLTYHRFGRAHRDPFCVTPEEFAGHMSLLTAQQRAVSLGQVVRFLRGEESLPDHACLVTIDDGMRSTVTEALPVLERYEIPAIAFVSSKLIGLDVPDLPEPYMSIGEIKRLSQSGIVTIGSHAHTHRSMGALTIDEVREEARRSRQLLSEHTGADIISFAYPFGMLLDFSQDTDNALRAESYEIAFNSMHGAVTPGMSAISLPRIKVESGESLRAFEKITRGAMDNWRIVDDNLWRLQRNRREIV